MSDGYFICRRCREMVEIRDDAWKRVDGMVGSCSHGSITALGSSITVAGIKAVREHLEKSYACE